MVYSLTYIVGVFLKHLSFCRIWYYCALTLLVGWQEGHPACKKTEQWGAGVVFCLERGADLHMAQLMPLPLAVSCFSKIQIGITFLVPAHPGSLGLRAVKRACVCVCVCFCVWYSLLSDSQVSISLVTHGLWYSVSGQVRAILHKWGLARSPSCDCGQQQIMNHIVDTCPWTKFEGGLNLVHKADDDSVIWLESTATVAVTK